MEAPLKKTKQVRGRKAGTVAALSGQPLNAFSARAFEPCVGARAVRRHRATPRAELARNKGQRTTPSCSTARIAPRAASARGTAQMCVWALRALAGAIVAGRARGQRRGAVPVPPTYAPTPRPTAYHPTASPTATPAPSDAPTTAHPTLPVPEELWPDDAADAGRSVASNWSTCDAAKQHQVSYCWHHKNRGVCVGHPEECDARARRAGNFAAPFKVRGLRGGARRRRGARRGDFDGNRTRGRRSTRREDRRPPTGREEELAGVGPRVAERACS